MTIEVGNLGYRLSVMGLYILSGSFLETQMILLTLAEIGLLIMVWAMRSSWRVVLNLYAVFMISIESIWIMSFIPYYLGAVLFILMLILFRVGALIRLNYTESKVTSV